MSQSSHVSVSIYENPVFNFSNLKQSAKIDRHTPTSEVEAGEVTTTTSQAPLQLKPAEELSTPRSCAADKFQIQEEDDDFETSQDQQPSLFPRPTPASAHYLDGRVPENLVEMWSSKSTDETLLGKI